MLLLIGRARSGEGHGVNKGDGAGEIGEAE